MLAYTCAEMHTTQQVQYNITSQFTISQTNYYHYYNNLVCVQDYLGRPIPEGYTILDSTEAEMMEWQWHQLDHMQVICTLLQTDNHVSNSSLSFYGPEALPAT